jgi:hypothetical protein
LAHGRRIPQNVTRTCGIPLARPPSLSHSLPQVTATLNG